MINHQKHTRLQYLYWLIPVAIYLIHASKTQGWIVDDAGITFAFSRNLAEGNGLVPQPHHELVEGFSNLLWLLLIAPFYKLGLFDPYLTPKILSAIFSFLSFYVIYKIVKKTGLPVFISILTCSLLALNTPIVIWANSGLENSCIYC